MHTNLVYRIFGGNDDRYFSDTLRHRRRRALRFTHRRTQTPASTEEKSRRRFVIQSSTISFVLIIIYGHCKQFLLHA